MGRHLVHYLPIVTTAVTVPFGLEVFRRFRQHPDRLHLLWWALGIVTYGVGTFTESLTTIIGWREPIFRAWYIAGALLGGAPLAQGTVYLLLSRRTANRLTFLLVSFVTIAARAGVPEHVIVRMINQTPAGGGLSTTLGVYQHHEYLSDRRDGTLKVAAAIARTVGGTDA